MRDVTVSTKPPIFIGGTGRSGTTVMGKLIASHRDYCKPAGENKLIVERFGLRTLVEELSTGFDYKSNHYTIRHFVDFAHVLRRPGLRNDRAAKALQGVNKVLRRVVRRQIRPLDVHRRFPSLAFSGYAIGQGFGLDHYDACIERFLQQLASDVDMEGVRDFEGIVRPVYAPASFDREVLLQMCRVFLEDLYAPHLQKTGSKGWCDDTPFSILYAPFLFELFPDARIIHMMRHPMDVFASHLAQPWASSDPDRTILRLQRLYQRLVAEDIERPDDRIMLVRLEDMPNDPDRLVTEISTFCGIDKEGFDGSVSFRKDSFWRWKKDLPEALQKKASERLSFAIAHYGYEV